MSMQQTWVQSLVQEDSTCHNATKSTVGHDYWAHTLEPQVLQQEKPPQWEAHTLQIEKPVCSNEDPAQPKVDKQIKSKKKRMNWRWTSSPGTHNAFPTTSWFLKLTEAQFCIYMWRSRVEREVSESDYPGLNFGFLHLLFGWSWANY